MSLEDNWVRGRPSKGKRQLNVRYEVSDEHFKPIEDLLERLPYSKVNIVMREALLLGAKIMLSTAQANVDNLVNTPTTRQSRSGSSSMAAPVAQPVQTPTPQPPAYGKAAQSMFEEYGTKK